MSDNKHEDFIENIFKDIKTAQEGATVHKDTQVVNFKPTWTVDVTEESLNKHIDFINHQGAVVAGGTSNIAFENYPETKAETWTGVMDFGGLKITAQTNMREVYDMGEDKKEYGYGLSDLVFDMVGTNGPAIDAFYDKFSEIDNERCKNLFED